MVIPELDDPNLAYESGVHLGDGSLDRYRYLISGDKTKETRYYGDVLAPLVQELYDIKPTISFENNSVACCKNRKRGGACLRSQPVSACQRTDKGGE
jgi:hypothetical protein